MTTLATRIREIGDLEGFDVEFYDQNWRVADVKNNGFKKFNYDRKSKGSLSVSSWIEKRFRPVYPGYNCVVLNGDGTTAHGNTLLSSVRATYEEE